MKMGKAVEMTNSVRIERPLDVKIDLLKFAYIDAKEKLLKESDALQINLTETFWTTIKDKIKHGELVVIAVRGEVRTGKSTIVLKIVWEMNKFITKIGKNPTAAQRMSQLIFSDQTEFLRFINTDDRNLALAIDEFNRMAETGLNATTEEALFEHYSNVFAGQYLHRVTASPDVITDKNATVILDVIGKDEEGKYVRCKLTYRDIVTKMQMVIGRVDIYVGDVIHLWDSAGIRQLVEQKGHLQPEEQALVDKARETDFYVKYQVKKYKKMDLLKKHGVRDIRDLEFSTIILQVLHELKEFARIKRAPKELIDTIVDEVCKTNKRIYSILAVNEISQRSRAILNIYFEINQLQKKLASDKLIPQEAIVFRKTLSQMEQLLDKRLAEQRKYASLYKDLMSIE